MRREVLLDNYQVNLLVACGAPPMAQAAGVVDAVASGRVAQLALDVDLDLAVDDVDELLARMLEVLIETAWGAHELDGEHCSFAAHQSAHRAAGGVHRIGCTGVGANYADRTGAASSISTTYGVGRPGGRLGLGHQHLSGRPQRRGDGRKGPHARP